MLILLSHSLSTRIRGTHHHTYYMQCTVKGNKPRTSGMLTEHSSSWAAYQAPHLGAFDCCQYIMISRAFTVLVMCFWRDSSLLVFLKTCCLNIIQHPVWYDSYRAEEEIASIFCSCWWVRLFHSIFNIFLIQIKCEHKILVMFISKRWLLILTLHHCLITVPSKHVFQCLPDWMTELPSRQRLHLLRVFHLCSSVIAQYLHTTRDITPYPDNSIWFLQYFPDLSDKWNYEWVCILGNFSNKGLWEFIVFINEIKSFVRKNRKDITWEKVQMSALIL